MGDLICLIFSSINGENKSFFIALWGRLKMWCPGGHDSQISDWRESHCTVKPITAFALRQQFPWRLLSANDWAWRRRKGRSIPGRHWTPPIGDFDLKSLGELFKELCDKLRYIYLSLFSFFFPPSFLLSLPYLRSDKHHSLAALLASSCSFLIFSCRYFP